MQDGDSLQGKVLRFSYVGSSFRGTETFPNQSKSVMIELFIFSQPCFSENFIVSNAFQNNLLKFHSNILMLWVLGELFMAEIFFYKVIFEHHCGNKFLWVETKVCPMECQLCLDIPQRRSHFQVVIRFPVHISFTRGYYFVGRTFHL